MPSINHIVVWIIIGLLGGSLAGLIITRERKGFSILRNLGVGLVGALVGGLVFRVLGIFPGLDKVAISLRDVVAALVVDAVHARALEDQRPARARPALAAWLFCLRRSTPARDRKSHAARLPLHAD